MESTCSCKLCPTNSDNIRLVGYEDNILIADDILNNKYIINNGKYINIQNDPDKCRRLIVMMFIVVIHNV